MISWIEKKTGLNFKGRPTVKLAARLSGAFPVEVRLGAHGTLHLDEEAARALLVELNKALTPTVKRGAA